MSVTALSLPWFTDHGPWTVRRRSDPAANAHADRHYSRRRPGVGRVAGPGRALVLVTLDERATWVSTWPAFNADGLNAWRCSIFRNEGAGLSSELIRTAMELTAGAWGEPPADGWATWVDTRKVASRNPGYCFKAAGWWLDRTYRPGRRQQHLIRLRAAA